MHFDSYMPFEQKRSIMMACLTKVQERSNDWKKMGKSILDKLYEFLKLGYPAGMLRYMCAKLAYITRDTAWYTIRQSLPPSINYNNSNMIDYEFHTSS